jgi:GAF domain-containing protein/anti-sigma regulatory factor (Ser/Thr protein kinase)
MSRSVEVEPHLTSEGLRDLLEVVNSSRDLDEILEYLVVQAQTVLGSDAVSLYLRVPENPNLLRMKAAYGIPAHLLNPELSASDPTLQALDEGVAATYGTIAAVPLVAHSETYGSVLLYYHAPNAHSPDKVNLSLAFAHQAALAIENSHLRAEAERRLIEIERRRRVAEALRDLMAVVNSHQDLDEVLTEVLAQSHLLLGNDAAVVYLRDDDDGEILRARASAGFEQDYLASEVRVGSPTTGLAVQQGRTLVCEDLVAALSDELTSASDTRLEDDSSNGFGRIVRLGARTDPDLEPGSNEPRVRRMVTRFRAVVSTPLVASGRIFGALSLYYEDARAFSADDVDLARTFAEQATQAIESARLHSELQRRMYENERRRQVAEGMRDLLASVNSTRSLDEMLDLVLSQASGLLDCDAGSILLLDTREENPSILTVRASRALVANLLPNRLPVGTAITGVAVAHGMPVVVSDVLTATPVHETSEPIIELEHGYLRLLRIGNPPGGLEPTLDEFSKHYRAILAAPLAVRGRVEGAITLYYSAPRAFSTEELGLAQAFADQTALAVANARLHTQTTRRSRDLEALYRADEVLYRSLQLDQVLQGLVDVAKDVLEADMSSVLIWDDRHENLIPGATRGFRAESVARMSHAPGEGITTRVALSGEPIAVEDAMSDPRVAHRITDDEGIRSLLHVPIRVNDAVFGVFGVNYREARQFSGAEERLLLALAHRAALAIENAQLYTESERRRHELEALYRADHTLHSSLRLDDVLQSLLDVASDVLNAQKISVTIWDPETDHLVTAATRGYSSDSTALRLLASQDLPIEELMKSEILVITDAANDPRLASPRLQNLLAREGIRTALAAPILIAGQPFGMFSVASSSEQVPSMDEERLVQALAQRAGLAIQNARLFEQAQKVATAEERQRLARELHDAVTQTLFSASLIAEVLPRLWTRDPELGLHRLEQLRRLTRGALAEMRTLLLELRPAALVETPFVQLLKELAQSVASRSNLDVEVRAESGPVSLPADVQIGLYRIVQEALNNTLKHAEAQHAEVILRSRDNAVSLGIRDDGKGFDTSRPASGRLGLNVMRERAHGVGARLRVLSRPGEGTRVYVHWRRPV